MKRLRVGPSVCLVAWGALAWAAPSHGAVTVDQVYEAAGAQDQDDMCLWVHPTDPGQSVIVTSDKASGHVYVYDLEGNPLQSIATPMPGNIDLRYGIQLAGECVDVIAFNERAEQKIRVYRVDPETRLLARIDDGSIVTGANYGLALSRREDGALFGVTGPSGGNALLRQYELVDDGQGHITGSATGWQFQESTVEGMVADDDAGWLYLAEEDAGIWRVRLDDDSDTTLIAAVGGASGLVADVEGLTIYHLDEQRGYLIASSQAANKFEVFDREPPHAPRGDFSIAGVGNTDGIDVANVALGDVYGQGVFTFHNAQDCCPVQSARWEAIAAEIGLLIDTTAWHPRRPCGPRLEVSRTALVWSPSSPAESYDVVRGNLGTLRATAGNFTAATTSCLIDNTVATVLGYSSVPAAGQGEWYLVRGVASFGALSYDSYSSQQVAPRDPEINAAAAACP